MTEHQNVVLLATRGGTVADGKYYALLAADSNTEANEVALLLSWATANPDKVSPGSVRAHRVSSVTGQQLRVAELDTSEATGIDVWSMYISGASMRWDVANDRIGVTMTRKHTRTNDGLNHQAGCFFALDPGTMKRAQPKYTQTASHSWDNSLVLSLSGGFLGMSLGDNHPRGIPLYGTDADSTGWTAKMVFEIKTKHGVTPTNPAGARFPVYKNISDDVTTFYEYSNDNDVYAELAHPGLVEIDKTVLVFFAGERPSLDNAKAVKNTVPRNLACVKESRALATRAPVGGSPRQEGGYFTFDGHWRSQYNQGVHWLTSFQTTDQNVMHIKTASVTSLQDKQGADDTETRHVIVVYEVWSLSRYLRTVVAVVDQNCQLKTSKIMPNHQLRLMPRNDAVSSASSAVLYRGDGQGHLIRTSILRNECESAADCNHPPPCSLAEGVCTHGVCSYPIPAATCLAGTCSAERECQQSCADEGCVRCFSEAVGGCQECESGHPPLDGCCEKQCVQMKDFTFYKAWNGYFVEAGTFHKRPYYWNEKAKIYLTNYYHLGWSFTDDPANTNSPSAYATSKVQDTDLLEMNGKWPGESGVSFTSCHARCIGVTECPSPPECRTGAGTCGACGCTYAVDEGATCGEDGAGVCGTDGVCSTKRVGTPPGEQPKMLGTTPGPQTTTTLTTLTTTTTTTTTLTLTPATSAIASTAPPELARSFVADNITAEAQAQLAAITASQAAGAGVGVAVVAVLLAGFVALLVMTNLREWWLLSNPRLALGMHAFQLVLWLFVIAATLVHVAGQWTLPPTIVLVVAAVLALRCCDPVPVLEVLSQAGKIPPESCTSLMAFSLGRFVAALYLILDMVAVVVVAVATVASCYFYRYDVEIVCFVLLVAHGVGAVFSFARFRGHTLLSAKEKTVVHPPELSDIRPPQMHEQQAPQLHKDTDAEDIPVALTAHESSDDEAVAVPGKAKAVTIVPTDAGLESKKVAPDPLETGHESEQAMALPAEDSDPPAPPPKRKHKHKK